MDFISHNVSFDINTEMMTCMSCDYCESTNADIGTLKERARHHWEHCQFGIQMKELKEIIKELKETK